MAKRQRISQVNNFWKSAAICLVIAPLFYVLTIPFWHLLPVFGTTEVRPTAVMNPILGLFFGVPGALGCTLGNMLVDVYTGSTWYQVLIYAIPQFLYGITSRIIWKWRFKNDPDRYRLNSMPKVLWFCLTVLAAALILGLCMYPAIYFFMPDSFDFVLFCFGNNSVLCLYLGFPLLIGLNWLFSPSRRLCKCEQLLLVTAAFETVSIFLIVMIFDHFTDYENLLEATVLTRIYVVSLIAIIVIIMVSLIVIGLNIGRELDAQKYDLQAAAVIQSSMLPTGAADGERFSLNAFMKPAREVGGDFYDYQVLEGNRLAFAVADVSGKGMSAALFMVRAISTLRNYVQIGLSAEEIFERTNHSLCVGNDKQYFVTAWMGILNLENGELDFVNAGHPAPVFRTADGEVREIADGGNVILGVMDNRRYRAGHLQMQPGDLLLLYTDGVTEARNDENEMYEERRLHRTVRKAPDTTREVCDALLKSVTAFSEKCEQFDDITALAVQYQTAKGTSES